MDEEVANHVMYPIKFENRMTSFEVLRKLANHDKATFEIVSAKFKMYENIFYIR